MNGNHVRQIYKNRIYLLMVLPAVIWFLVFCYIPMGGIVIAFKDYSFYKGFADSPWVGFKWFEMLFNSRDFFKVLRNTIVIGLLKMLFTPCPIILALMLNECKQRNFKRVIQTVSYLPHFLSWSVIAGLMITLLSPSVGVVNQVIKTIGFEPIYFMANPNYIRPLFVASSLWKGVGWGSIIYLAAITNIDLNLYEAAIMDGAGKLRQIWHITLPAISNLIIMMMILNISWMILIGFEQAYNLVTPATYSKGLVTSVYMFKMGVQQMKYGLGTAVGFFQSTVSILLLVIANYIARLFNKEAALW